MRRAARTDANHEAVATAFKRCGLSVLSLAQLGAGVPDLLVAGKTVGTFLVEVKDGSKAPSARKLTPDQEVWHRGWKGDIYIVTDAADVPEVIGRAAKRRMTWTG